MMDLLDDARTLVVLVTVQELTIPTGSPRQGMQLVRAAAVADQSFDLKSILEDSLKAPVKGSEGEAPASSVSPISPAIPEAPSQPPQVAVVLITTDCTCSKSQTSKLYLSIERDLASAIAKTSCQASAAAAKVLWTVYACKQQPQYSAISSAL